MPTVDLPRSADAIVSLDGDRPRRLRRAVELAAQGVAPTPVVVRGDAVAPELLTARGLPFEVLSVVPEPSTTRGEARAVARLASERDWRRICCDRAGLGQCSGMTPEQSAQFSELS